MSTFSSLPLRLLVLAPLLSQTLAAFEGEATFYGAGGAGDKGACLHSPGFNGVGITVAMNAEQYADGGACGKCIVARGAGAGAGSTPVLGPIYATVDNQCPECKFGDVDFGLGGDGRWRITWDFVDCAVARRAGSHLPSNTSFANATTGNDAGKPAAGGKRSLRGLVSTTAEAQGEQQPAVTDYLAPGFMVTSDGIKLIADVVAARQKAEQEAQSLGASPATTGKSP